MIFIYMKQITIIHNQKGTITYEIVELMMHILNLIKKICDYYPVDGVTTNPSILAKSGRQPFEVLKEIRSFIGKDAELHVQVVAKDAEGMVEDAHRIVKELGANTYVKVPSVPEGFKAMKISR